MSIRDKRLSNFGLALSGDLGYALRRHAETREEKFFMYLFYLKALCDRAAILNLVIKPVDALSVVATDQLDTGFRDLPTPYSDFDAKDPNVVNINATAFRNSDAAHYCNLGLKADAWARFGAVNDTPLQDLVERVKRTAGLTRQLPQRVNIGPDRVVDVAHGDLAKQFLGTGRPVLRRDHVTTYQTTMRTRLNEYKAGQLLKGNKGVAACVDSYLAAYKGGDTTFSSVMGEITGLCATRSYGLKEADYISWI
jgi:hypothetical protein